VRRLAGDLGEEGVEALAQLVRVVVALGAATAGDHDAGGRDAGEAGEPYELPG